MISVGSLLATAAPCVAADDSAKAEAKPKLETPRDWFKLYGVDESHFAKFLVGEPLGDDETEPLLKVIYQMRRFEPTELQAWAHREFDVAKLAADVPAFQSDIYAVAGRLRNVTVLKPVEEVASLFEMPEYYRCEIELAGGGAAVVYAAAAPKAWKQKVPEGQDARVAALGAFVKTTARGDDPTPAFAAARIAWFPDTPLGDLEFDYGLFDEVYNGPPPEAEPFYQLMAAARRSKPGALLTIARETLARLAAERPDKPTPPATEEELIRDPLRRDAEGNWHYSALPLIYHAKEHRGELVSLSGTARQVQKIAVSDEVKQRFDISHYYQVSLYTDDVPGPQGRHPIVFCVLELPEGMPVGSTDRYGEAVTIAGFMMKRWGYGLHLPRGFDRKADEAREKDKKNPTQLVPLLIARDLVWHPAPPPAPRSTLAAVIAMGFLAVAVALAWIGMARLYRTKGTAAERPLPEKIDVPEKM